MSWEVRVVRNRYADSVRLMQIAQAVRARDAVRSCEVLMGTAANLEALAARGVRSDAGPTDVVIAVDTGESDAAAALDDAERELAVPAAGGQARAEIAPPRSLGVAKRELDAANVALISVPGQYAVMEAHRALTEGMHVFLFSDHVSAADELALKRRGEERGLLVMGPGCGTAMLGGVGLGFANAVRQGPVGIVAAAGTGAQEASVLLDAAGSGVSQIIGVGGRDLSADVGGVMFKAGMRLLAADDATETLLLVSKPPAAEVVRELGAVDLGGKRVGGCLV
jgi:FdrA protein